MSFAISEILLFTVSSDKGNETIFLALFWPKIFVPFLKNSALLVSHQLCEVLLVWLLSQELHMKCPGVVKKLSKSLTPGAFPSYHNKLFLL